MDISANVLRKDTVALIQKIERQIDEVTKVAFARNCEPHEVRDSTGAWSLAPLLQAKALAYNTLVLLQAKK
jgi:hypothetical protein